MVSPMLAKKYLPDKHNVIGWYVSEKLDGVVYGITSVDPTATPTKTASVTPSPTVAGVIPTSSNPTINLANAGSRTMANTSFELYDGTWTQMMNMTNMRGWKTTHRTSDTGFRVMEMWEYGSAAWYDALNGVAAPDGTRWVELNAYHASMLYQPICFADNEQFDFEFYHHPRSFSSNEIIELRFGIPTGLDAGSVAADSYSRQVLRGSTTSGANLAATATTLYDTYDGTLNESATVTTGNWIKYAGSHQLPAGWSGVKNLGFYGISPTGGSGNHLDKITINLQPIIDMGTSRDRSSSEQVAPTSLNIRINGRVAAGTMIALKKTSGSATADSDFTIGTVSAGANGTASVAHTSGTDTWLITIPAGDYDGGLVSGNNVGGLTIPVTYSYDLATESTEYAVFDISSEVADGATPDEYVLGDPTCDGSQKLDGAVYTITNVDPTNTPTSTPTQTFTPSLTATVTNTPAYTATNTPTYTLTNTATNTPTNTPTYTYTPTYTMTPTNTSTPTFTMTPAVPTAVIPTLPDISEATTSINLSSVSAGGLAVTISSTSPSVCTVTGKTVTIVGPGTCLIDIDIAAGTVGGISYAATKISRSFVVKAMQTVTFAALTPKIYNSGDFALTASASSTLAVSYTAAPASICTVSSGGMVSMLTPGTCTITAAQAGGISGGLTYAAATAVARSFTVSGVPQSITFAPLTAKHDYDPSFDLSGTASSGLTVSYTTSNALVCDVTGRRVRIYTKGACEVTAAQAGGTSAGIIYAAAAPVTQSFAVDDHTPTLTKSKTPTATVTNTPTKTLTMTPTPIPFMMKKGAVGASFVLGLLQNGTLVTWGMNKEFQANIAPCCGSGVDDIATGSNFAIVLKGGRVFGWGSNSLKQITFPKTTEKGIIAIAAGQAHAMALTNKGKVIAWGDNKSQQTKLPKSLKGIVAIAGGVSHSLALTSKGTVIAWGSNVAGQTKVPPTLKDVKAISGGLDHSLALKKDGMVVAWGGNAFGQSSVPTILRDVKTISAGTQFSMALKNDGTAFGWGRNDSNQITIPAGYTGFFSVNAGYANSIIGLRNGGILVLGDQTNDVGVSRTPTKTATPTP